jgi:hypothetical protein
MRTDHHTDSFGFLFEKLNFSFDGGSVRTSREFVKSRKWVNSQVNNDGYIYPLTSYTATQNIKTKRWKRIPKTTRPAKFFHMPPSHDISLLHPTDQKSDRYGLAGFVVQSLSFLYGTKLQFFNWFIEGRVPVKTQTINLALHTSDVETFFHRAVPAWLSYSEINKRRMVNLLFVHSVAGAVEWDWQRFLLEYMVTDACYRIADEIKKCRAPRHQDRLKALSDSFGLAKDDHWFDFFVRLRNNLFHETLWDGGRLFTSPSSESFYAPLHLRRFNHRLVTVLLCGPGRYTKTKWTSIGTYAYFLD